MSLCIQLVSASKVRNHGTGKAVGIVPLFPTQPMYVSGSPVHVSGILHFFLQTVYQRVDWIVLPNNNNTHIRNLITCILYTSHEQCLYYMVSFCAIFVTGYTRPLLFADHEIGIVLLSLPILGCVWLLRDASYFCSVNTGQGQNSSLLFIKKKKPIY